ncbi:MAG TPA: hypothetical protein PLG05_09720 [Bacteroidales bacterium]|nr:hypothetical protein [Bacteroidales bacterium]HOR61033.1 hypothetical protein [Bacteroidales bacterium]HPL05440.1 hypothetical protein [Bacteroidales bacterium]
MKKVLLFTASALIIFGLSSCGSKKAETLEDLKQKYDGKEFADCDEYIKAANEVIDVFITTVEKATKGDEKAFKDIEGLGAIMVQFGKQEAKLEKECPDKIKAFNEKAKKRMATSYEQLNILMFSKSLGGDFSWDETSEEAPIEGEEVFTDVLKEEVIE